jgi:hypothetical protein
MSCATLRRARIVGFLTALRHAARLPRVQPGLSSATPQRLAALVERGTLILVP